MILLLSVRQWREKQKKCHRSSKISFVAKYLCIFLLHRDSPNWRTVYSIHRIDATRREREQNMKKKNVLKSRDHRGECIYEKHTIYNAGLQILLFYLFCLRHMCSIFSLQNFITKSLFLYFMCTVYCVCVHYVKTLRYTYRNRIPHFFGVHLRHQFKNFIF